MYKKIGGLIAAISGLASAGNAQATPVASAPQLTKAQSFVELLDPIPNAAALLRVADAAAVAAARQSGSSKNPNLKLVYDHHHHHHNYHHHHHQYPTWWYRQHHHHHNY